jgi:hypothetical protein
MASNYSDAYYSVITSIPRLLLFIFAIPRLAKILRRPTLSVPATLNYRTKLALSLILAALPLADLYIHYNTIQWAPEYKHHLLYDMGGVVVYLFAAFLHHVEHFRSCIGSTALLFFWLFSILANIIQLRTQILMSKCLSNGYVNRSFEKLMTPIWLCTSPSLSNESTTIVCHLHLGYFAVVLRYLRLGKPT